MWTCAVSRAGFLTAVVAGTACVLSIGADARLTTFFSNALPACTYRQAMTPPRAQTTSEASYSTDSFKTTELPNHYRLVEKINFESDINYLQKSTAYLPTLKVLNPGLFDQTNLDPCSNP